MTTLATFAEDTDYIEFDEKTRAAYIGLPALARTFSIEDTGGNLPKSAPIEHHRLIERILYMGNQHTPYNAVLKPITIRETHASRIRHKKEDGDCPIEKYHIQRLVAKISFDDTILSRYEDSAGSMSIAVSYTEKGIQVAFGHNVYACDNLNIFGQYMFSTYGNNDNKVPFEKGMELLEKWLMSYESVRDFNEDRIIQLRSVDVDEHRRLEIMGKLFERAVRLNNGERTIEAPLNQTECAEMIRAGYDLITKDEVITAWDMTNWATSVLKPNRTDMVSILESNRQINQFLWAELIEAE